MSERYGGGINGEFSGVEDDETGICHDFEHNSHGASELARGEVRFQPYVVAFWDSKFWEPRLPFEFLHGNHNFHILSFKRKKIRVIKS